MNSAEMRLRIGKEFAPIVNIILFLCSYLLLRDLFNTRLFLESNSVPLPKEGIVWYEVLVKFVIIAKLLANNTKMKGNYYLPKVFCLLYPYLLYVLKAQHEMDITFYLRQTNFHIFAISFIIKAKTWTFT